MALTDARILRSLKLTESKGDKQTVQLSGTQDLLILADTKDPGFADILADTTVWPNLGNARLPQLDDTAVINGVELFVTSRSLAYYEDNERAVVMSVRYDAKTDEGSQSDPPQPGDSATWKRLTVQTQSMTKPADGWKSLGAAAAALPANVDFARNSAGDPVDGLEEDVAMIKVVYTNTQAANPNFKKLNEYVNTCNDDTIDAGALSGFGYSIRCMGYNADYDQRNNVWSVSVEFLYHPDGWAIQYYDVGFNELINDKRVAILDTRGNPVSKPVPLDGAGRAAAIDTDVTGDESPVPLTILYLYPYKAVKLLNIFADCNI